MPLSLYVLRHAKAESAAPAGGGDHERPLRRRGQRAARAVGRFLARLGETPEAVLCSTAVRARETAEIARDAGGWSAPLVLRRAVYEATPAALLREIRACAAGTPRLLLVGHEPGLSNLIAELTGTEPVFPTAALARIDFEVERWNQVQAEGGRLAWLVTPETIAVSGARKRAREAGE
jgi:phosphohistidine phosphatase